MLPALYSNTYCPPVRPPIHCLISPISPALHLPLSPEHATHPSPRSPVCPCRLLLQPHPLYLPPAHRPSAHSPPTIHPLVCLTHCPLAHTLTELLSTHLHARSDTHTRTASSPERGPPSPPPPAGSSEPRAAACREPAGPGAFQAPRALATLAIILLRTFARPVGATRASSRFSFARPESRTTVSIWPSSCVQGPSARAVGSRCPMRLAACPQRPCPLRIIQGRAPELGETRLSFQNGVTIADWFTAGGGAL